MFCVGWFDEIELVTDFSLVRELSGEIVGEYALEVLRSMLRSVQQGLQ